jgi:hypothetical protein
MLAVRLYRALRVNPPSVLVIIRVLLLLVTYRLLASGGGVPFDSVPHWASSPKDIQTRHVRVLK